MKKLGLFFAFTAIAAFGAEWTGHISDSKCGAKHADGSAGSIACVKACIKGGGSAVFVVGDKVLKLANADKVSEDLYGAKVKITGNLEGDTVTIDSIAKAD
jgi:hypothetical protein